MSCALGSAPGSERRVDWPDGRWLDPVAYVLVCLALFAVAGCHSVVRKQHLVVAIPSAPVSAIPNTTAEEYTDTVLRNVYEPLVAVDPSLRLVPGLAESWYMLDSYAWVFSLREGVNLHDGRKLEAHQVAASLQHARTDPSSKRQAQLAMVQSIECPDARTLIVRTKRPFNALPARLAAVMVWVPGGPADRPVGTGPYRIESWTEGGDVVLTAFAGYRSGTPAIRRVEFRVVPDALQRIRQLDEGGVDLALDAPAERMSEIGARPGLKTAWRNGLRVIFLVMDCASERSLGIMLPVNPFKDRRVRQALAFAINRPGLIEGPLGGFGEVMDQIVVPQEFGGGTQAFPIRSYDPAEARRLLAEAGLPAGFTVEMDFMPDKYRAMTPVVTALVEDLGKAGISIVARPRSAPDMIERIQHRTSALYVMGWMSDTGDGRPTYEYLLHTRTGSFGMFNGGGYSSSDLDAMIEKAAEPLPREEQEDLLRRIAAHVYQELPVIPLYRQGDLYALADDLSFQPRLDRRLRIAEISWQ